MKQFLLLSCCLLLSAASYAQGLAPADEQFVDSLMNATYKPGEPGGVLLIAKKGVPVFRKAYGLASMELAVPNQPTYRFRIGSMSKQFTAVCILKLAQEGKLALSDDLTKYLPDYNAHKRHITIENLLTHTSGITSYSEKSGFELSIMTDLSTDSMMRFFMNDSLLFEPGTDWSYSNSGFLLLGLIVEKVSGIPLSDYLRQNILEPLGMSATAVESYESVIANAASGYEPAGTDKYKPASYLSWNWTYGAGGIRSTVDDLLKWDNALYTDKIVKKEWLEKAWKPYALANGQLANYGFGWSVSNYQNVKFIVHGGAVNGFLSDGIRIQPEGIYIVLLSNNAAKNPSDASTDIALRIAGLAKIKPASARMDKRSLERYTGVYALHRMGSRIATNATDVKLYRYVTIKDDTLMLQSSGDEKRPLLNVSKDIFVAKGHHTYYQFRPDKQGAIASMEIYGSPVKYGPDELVPKTSLPLPVEKVTVAIAADKLSALAGKYDFGGGFSIQVSIAGDKVYCQATGQDKAEVFAESESKFFFKVIDATIEFTKDNGEVTGMVLNQAGKHAARKIE